MEKGRLLLLPTPLGDGALQTIPPYVVRTIDELDYFIAERAKTARHFIRAILPEKKLPPITIFELNKRTPEQDKPGFLQPAENGHDIGLLSEAGCPGVADPGAGIVALAHARQIPVVPLVGPSSLLLALMASGLNGQQFCFHGYLSPKRPQLSRQLKQLEKQMLRNKQTQLFIETPYRNRQLLEEALKALNPNTRLVVAVDLTLPSEQVISRTVADWKKSKLPDLHKRPAIFLMG